MIKMDPYKQLKLEFKGIRNTIEEYTSGGNITNFLDGLESALEIDDFEYVQYYLNEITLWYEKNIREILTNQFVFDGQDHERNLKIVQDINKKLETYNFENVESKNNQSTELKNPKIFLSHSSADKEYGDALQKLITGLGVKNNQLIYTSHPLHKIPLNANIYDYLRENIGGNVFVIILWSNKYLESPACLNEMGAAWVAQSDYTNIYTPDFEFGNPKYHECAVDTRKMGAVLKGDAHCKASMIEFRNKILNIFGLEIDEQTWTYYLDNFIEEVKEITNRKAKEKSLEEQLAQI